MLHLRSLITAATLAVVAPLLVMSPASSAPPSFETIAFPIATEFEDFCGVDGLSVVDNGTFESRLKDPHQGVRARLLPRAHHHRGDPDRRRVGTQRPHPHGVHCQGPEGHRQRRWDPDHHAAAHRPLHALWS